MSEEIFTKEELASAAVEYDEEPSSGFPGWAKIAIVATLLFGGMLYMLLGSEAGEAFVYSRLVNEVVADPSAHMGRELRVEGDLKKGSVLFREAPCEWRFEIQKEGATMPVSFPQCVVPDTFRDDYGISVTVQGRLDDNGTLIANQVIPRCPSKYEEKAKNGEAIPENHRQ